MSGVNEAEISDVGGPAPHIPVLLAECMEALDLRSDRIYLDGTFGAGGYTRAMLAKGARVIGVDRDPSAIAAGQALVDASAGHLTLVKGRFGELDALAREAGFATLDGVALDIGVSSMQLDQGERGFSLRHDAPLDMRMESEGLTAADILLEADEAQLADIFFSYGEMIARVAPARPGELTHPATKAFQALRIAVNDELGQLVRGLAAAERILKPGGRLVVVTFHSLEDRIVKQFFARRSSRGKAVSRLLPGEPPVATPSFRLAPGQPISAGPEELAANSRARSAKLRFGERLHAPAFDIAAELAALPQIRPARGSR